MKNVDFDLRPGEVHALVGENGAGKSTLMKVLTGIYKADRGTITYRGEQVQISGAKQAQNMGISIVHQELNLMNHLTAAQNIFIGREGDSFITNDRVINEKTQELFDMFKISYKPTDLVGSLTVGKQQMVEIAKAVSFDSTILVLDEPTAALTANEIGELFKIMNQLREKGVAMVYVSHRMDEIMEISDRITVMRDGEQIKTLNTKETNLDEIIQAMVGRTIYEEPKTHSTVPKDAEVILAAKNLESKDVKDISFELRKGEILGFAGLMGAGRTEVARLLFGADRKTSGEIIKDGVRKAINSPKDAVKAGIAYLSEDRKRFGLAIGLSVCDNMIIADMDNFCRRGFVKGLVAVYPTQLPRADEIALDGRVLARRVRRYAARRRWLAGIAAGAAGPTPRSRPRPAARSSADSGADAGADVCDGLVVGQVATSVALLFAAGLLVRTFMDMTAIKPGFDARNVLTFDMAISRSRYPTPERQSGVLRRAVRLAARDRRACRTSAGGCSRRSPAAAGAIRSRAWARPTRRRTCRRCR